MYELVHQYAPDSPAGRTAVAIIASLIGVPALVLGLIGITGNAVANGFLFLLASLALLAVAWCMTLGVVRQANAAPDATPLTNPQTEDVTQTPVETLRQRYAEGKLSDKEFQRRLDQLLETEEAGRTVNETERVFE
ncbi:SHOCT domain-containing protein [Halogeometricum borinquense]|uniref:SHOCT domain-containing protein n=1 Tax=Halogeometricum borinquense TaxID=60847 RepID=A0A482T8F6_9EURY|nr:SHOCT domain-containing protein [Halogeometricum borinquense]RYJ08189.1 SHOCT domain-containing protein [Halogeometricum borinquense]